MPLFAKTLENRCRNESKIGATETFHEFCHRFFFLTGKALANVLTTGAEQYRSWESVWARTAIVNLCVPHVLLRKPWLCRYTEQTHGMRSPGMSCSFLISEYNGGSSRWKMRVQCLPHHDAPTFHVCHILGYSPKELDLHHSFNSIKKYDDYRSISTIFFVRDGIFRNEIESAFLLQVYEKPCRVYTEILRSLKNSKKKSKRQLRHDADVESNCLVGGRYWDAPWWCNCSISTDLSTRRRSDPWRYLSCNVCTVPYVLYHTSKGILVDSITVICRWLLVHIWVQGLRSRNPHIGRFWAMHELLGFIWISNRHPVEGRSGEADASEDRVYSCKPKVEKCTDTRNS